MTMDIHIHIHHHGDDKLFTEIKSINSKLEIMGEKLDQIKEQLSGINDATNNIAADLERLAGQISGGLTAEEATSVVDDLKATASKLKAIADINPEPTPPAEPTA
jgi:methyl-accepting chemotaxis protein